MSLIEKKIKRLKQSQAKTIEISKTTFEVKEVNLWYLNGKKQALKNIEINIPKGKVTAFIGPSGCGKSTFLRCFNQMNDLIPGVIIEGSIKFDGKSELISDSHEKNFRNLFGLLQKKSNSYIAPLELRTRVGMVFQKPNPFPMSIYNNVAYGPKSSGIKDKKELDVIVKSALEDAALWEEVKDSLHESALGLSGGQQQRLCIARSIALEPEVLLMDEPTSALDPIATSKIEDLIQKLKKKYTIIIVTHSMQQAARISDFTAFFYIGELIEFNRTKKIFTNPKKVLTGRYINGEMG